MLVPTIIMGTLAIILVLVGYYQGQGQHIGGLRLSINMIAEILPLFMFAFVVAGMVQVLIPQEAISKWVGAESGMRGIILGSVAGGLIPGGPYVSLPVAAGFLRGGAGVGSIVAFLAGWSLWSIPRLPMEVGILGWQFTLVRIASTFFFPPVAGLIAQTFFPSAK